MPFEQKLEIIKHIEAKDLFTKTYGWFPHVWIPYMQSLLGVFYLGRVWKFVVKTQNNFTGEKLLSQWDVFFAVGFLLLYVSNGYMYLLTNELLKDVDQMPFMNKISVIHTLMTFALFISYFVIKDSSLRTPVERSTEKYPLEEIEELAKISTTKVDKEPDIVNLQDFELIKNVLDKSKSYRNHKFTISELAMEVGIQPYAISNAINTVAKMNYNDFINSYRIKAFTEKVVSKEYQNYTIEAIANECGFKSKSTFFTAFKKQTGLTPNQYLKKHDMELEEE
jgi:AraC-like DNA-binding protein